MADSLVIGDVIELLGGGVPTTHPLCPGAIFRLAPGFSLSSPQISPGTVASLLLGGGAPIASHVDNRQPVLPVVIIVPPTGDPLADEATLAGAREALAQAVSEPRWTLTWTRDGALPMLLDCFAATAVTRTYSIIKDKQLVSEVEVGFDAMPYGRSDTPEVILFAAPSTGWQPPPSAVTLDTFASVASGVNPAQWSLSSTGMLSPNSARWARQAGSFPDYTHTPAAPLDITGRNKITLWVGLGTATYNQWHTGAVTVQIILTDGGGTTASIAAHVTMLASNLITSPRWNKVSAPIPQVPGFDFTTVTSYEVKVWNRTTAAGPVLQAECYLDTLTAAPASTTGTIGPRGQLYQLPGAVGTAPAALTVQLQPGPLALPTSATFTTAGSNNWTAPAGVTQVAQAECWGGGGGGGAAGPNTAGGGGAGGEYACDFNIPVTPATVYHPVVGGGGSGGLVSGPVNGGTATDSTFTGDAGRVVRAHGGTGGGQRGQVYNQGLGGTGSTAPVHFDGGDGQYTGGGTSGGGGGGSAGTNQSGIDCHNTLGSGLWPGAPAVVGGSRGGDGGRSSATPHSAPADPYVPGSGGGGGALDSGGNRYNGAAGTRGQVRLTWGATSTPPLKTAVVHLPPREITAVAPLVVTGNGTDVPNGATTYTCPATGSVPARYHGTYQVILCVGTWNNPSAARTITWTIFQRLAGGASLSAVLTKTLTPNTDPDLLRPLTGLVTMGTVNLPLAAIAPGNQTDYFQITVNDTNTSDRVLDTLILSTSGQTAIYSTAGTGQGNLWFTEPDIGMDYGTVYGSAADWGGASSVMADTPVLSGGPLAVQSGENPFLVYSVQGLPGAQASYLPRWWLDRLA